MLEKVAEGGARYLLSLMFWFCGGFFFSILTLEAFPAFFSATGNGFPNLRKRKHG